MTTLTIPEASILTGKSEVTIRRVVKSKKVIAQKTSQGYSIDKESLLSLYKEVKTNDNQTTSHTYNIETDKNILEAVKPLIDRINWYDTRRTEDMRLLESGKNEKDQMEKELKGVISEKERIIDIKNRNLSRQRWIMIWISVVFLVSILVIKGIIVVSI